MPELPEVTTTVNGLNEVLPNLTIRDVWTDYFLRTTHKRLDTIKNEKYFKNFKKQIIGEKVKVVERRGKNILIHSSHNKTILIHMKMTGHLLYGKYNFDGKIWKSKEKFLSDPFNQFIHFVVGFSNGKQLAFSDMRKFAKVILFKTDERDELSDIKNLGPEPLNGLSLEVFKKQLSKRPNKKIKTVLIDQEILAGIGNIYSDEILWTVGIHPERLVKNIENDEFKKMYDAMKKVLKKGVEMGGDSMSDYRNIYGKKGNFQNSHKAYRRTGQNCLKPGCKGKIIRKIIGGRSAHFCSIHQK